jgi:hypothetical protein
MVVFINRGTEATEAIPRATHTKQTTKEEKEMIVVVEVGLGLLCGLRASVLPTT